MRITANNAWHFRLEDPVASLDLTVEEDGRGLVVGLATHFSPVFTQRQAAKLAEWLCRAAKLKKLPKTAKRYYERDD
jgi:hypothetical protein